MHALWYIYTLINITKCVLGYVYIIVVGVTSLPTLLVKERASYAV